MASDAGGSGEAHQGQAAVGKDGRLLFTRMLVAADVWSQPVNAGSGTAAGQLRQVTDDHGVNESPSVTIDGTRLVYVSKKSGLRDISVSRKRIKWGIPWPDDPEQVFYVWYDALTGYLTGIGYAQAEQGGPDFQKYWRHDASGEVVHMIGAGDEHQFIDAGSLERVDGPLNHRLVAHGEQMLVRDLGERVEPRAGPAGEDDALHGDAMLWEEWS